MIASPLDQAVAAHRAGNLAEAERLYRAALAANSQNADAWALLGVVLEARGEAAQAIACINQALQIDPHAALFHFYLGNALMTAGDAKQAAAAFRQTIALQPNMPQAHYNLGNALRTAEMWDEAAQAFAKTLQLAPSHVESRNNLALVYEKKGQLPEAVLELMQAVKSQPAYAEGWLNLCNLAEKKGDYELSLQAGQSAAILMPQNPSCWLGIGVALNRLERHEEALASYQKALALKPDWIELWDNIGQTYQFLNRLDDAEVAYRKTVVLAGQTIKDEDTRRVDEREYGNRHWHLALLELLKGDYKRGFARYRARFEEVGSLKRPNWPRPVWQGENLNGKTLLVGDEQGLGDCLMMARYLPILKAKGARIKLLVNPVLAPLFEGWTGADEVIARGNSVSGFDFHVSIFDLPYVFGTTLNDIPAQVPYLPVPMPDESTRLNFDGRLKLAVVWAGAPKHKHDARRSLPLEIFAELFSETDAQFFSLNRDMRPGDEETLARFPVTNLAPRLRHMGDAARFMAQMDLVITCDTAPAHLAGGMGKKVWTLLPFAPDWRWLIGRDDSPWYPTMRLFRQTQSGDWAGVITRARKTLADMF